MKKLLALTLVTMMTFSLVACTGEKAQESTDDAVSEQGIEGDVDETLAAEDANIAGADDLEGKRIGVQLGTTGDIFATDYEGDEAGTKIDRFNKGNDAVMALKQGKLDCVIIDEQPAKAFVEKNDDLVILDEEFAIEEYAIAISHENTELKENINRVLAEMKADGTLESIINNYIGDDTKGLTPYESPADVERSNGTLTMATNAAFPPYEYQEGGKVVGIDPDMAQAIADRLGMELVITDMEFDTIIAAIISGKADIGVAGMTVTEERLKNVDFTDNYTTAKQVIIVRK
jgi:ABC-type amino acid transport/signal transduction systems, periplasmic component/domain